MMEWLKSVVPIYVRHWGDNLQFYPIFNITGVEARARFFHVSKLSEDKKKGFHQKFKRFCLRNHVKTKKKLQTSSIAQM